jgi:hypothetical protein
MDGFALFARVARFFLVQIYQRIFPPNFTEFEFFGLKTNHLATILFTNDSYEFLLESTLNVMVLSMASCWQL